ncbi:MAG: protein kinase [Deltaproteobacteria bacterium]|nr:protein kinase [Deltaproteobacteria bacterium]
MGHGGIYCTVPLDYQAIREELTAVGVDSQKFFDKRYRIQAIIGKGQRGFVFMVTDSSKDHARSAIKVISPKLASDEKLRERIFRSVDLCRNLKHQNIVTISQHAKADSGLWYYKMEFVNGFSLERILHDEKCPELNFQ